MTWNRKQLKKGAWNTVFKRGLMAWMAMVAVCFIFSYLGVDDSSQTKFVKGIDQVLGQETEHEADNVTILKEYVKNMPMIEHMSEKKAETVARAIDSVTADLDHQAFRRQHGICGEKSRRGHSDAPDICSYHGCCPFLYTECGDSGQMPLCHGVQIQ